jgi:hypothetical protein
MDREAQHDWICTWSIRVHTRMSGMRHTANLLFRVALITQHVSRFGSVRFGSFGRTKKLWTGGRAHSHRQSPIQSDTDYTIRLIDQARSHPQVMFIRVACTSHRSRGGRNTFHTSSDVCTCRVVGQVRHRGVLCIWCCSERGSDCERRGQRRVQQQWHACNSHTTQPNQCSTR